MRSSAGCISRHCTVQEWPGTPATRPAACARAGSNCRGLCSAGAGSAARAGPGPARRGGACPAAAS
eukprot:1277805-Alexandrium_andersonii.AAC.1